MVKKISLWMMVICLVAVCASCAAMKERKNKSRAHFKLGVSYLNEDRLQNAYVEFNKSLNLNDKDHETHNALGNVFLMLEEQKKAEEAFKEAVSIYPEYSDAHNNLCFIYYLQKKWEESILSCNRALSNKVYGTPEKAYYNLGRTYYRNQRYYDAIRSFENAIKRYSIEPQLYYSLALAYNRAGMTLMSGGREIIEGCNAACLFDKAAMKMEFALKMDSRFKGDIDKAEQEFMKQKNVAEFPQDYLDYLEILRY
jgi:Tfp pilus assembly protein PilF